MPRTAKNVNIEVGQRIKQQRTAQGLTREQLARVTGYSANFIQDYLLNPCAPFPLRSRFPLIACFLAVPLQVSNIFLRN